MSRMHWLHPKILQPICWASLLPSCGIVFLANGITVLRMHEIIAPNGLKVIKQTQEKRSNEKSSWTVIVSLICEKLLLRFPHLFLEIAYIRHGLSLGLSRYFCVSLSKLIMPTYMVRNQNFSIYNFGHCRSFELSFWVLRIRTATGSRLNWMLHLQSYL